MRSSKEPRLSVRARWAAGKMRLGGVRGVIFLPSGNMKLSGSEPQFLLEHLMILLIWAGLGWASRWAEALLGADSAAFLSPS